MSFRMVVSLAGFLLACFAQSAPADVFDDCSQNLDPMLKYQSCTAIIQNPQVNANDAFLALANRGKILKEAGEFEASISDFSLAIQINPQSADIFNTRGTVYAERGDRSNARSDYVSAEQDFNRALQLEPNFVDAMLNRGSARQKLGEDALALEDFDKVLSIDPTNADAYGAKGIVFVENGDYAQGIIELSKAIEINPSASVEVFNRGAAYENSRQFDKAIADYERSIEIDGPPRIAQWQQILVQNGKYYQGPVDGQYTLVFQRALHACVRDLQC